MASWEDVATISLGLAEVEEGTSWGNRAWKVKGKLFAWERPLRKKEVEEPGDAAPAGEILGVRVPDEGAKQALIESEPEIYFTTAHFDGHASVLIRLDRIPRADLEEAILEAWHCRRT
jgi:hypothetical protein